MKQHRTLYFGLGILLSLVMLYGCDTIKQKPKTDWKVGLKREGKKPYDTYLAYHSAQYYFTEASLTPLFTNYNFEQINRSDNYYVGQGQALLVLVGYSVQFSTSEWEALVAFMSRGNKIVLLASNIDQQCLDQFRCGMRSGNELEPLSKTNQGSDNQNVLLLDSVQGKRYGYFGRDFKGYFEFNKDQDTVSNYATDTSLVITNKPTILGRVLHPKDKPGKPNFIRYDYGEGSITMIATPLVFSNYFLLQESNKEYLDAIWESVPGSVYQIYWANYNYRMPNESTFAILWRNKATRWALILILIAAATYLLFQIKRRQRMIPIMPKATNSSVAFIETVGMLYYNKGDNANLAQKMEQHFLEWVRQKLHLNTNLLNDAFAQQLSNKTGVALSEVNELLSIIHQSRLQQQNLNDEMLFDLYYRIQQFYKLN